MPKLLKSAYYNSIHVETGRASRLKDIENVSTYFPLLRVGLGEPPTKREVQARVTVDQTVGILPTASDCALKGFAMSGIVAIFFR